MGAVLTTPSKVQARIKRLKRLLHDRRPSQEELHSFMAAQANAYDFDGQDRLTRWESGDYQAGDMLGDFDQHRELLAAYRTAGTRGVRPGPSVALREPYVIAAGEPDTAEGARAWAVALADHLRASSDAGVLRWREAWLDGVTVPWDQLDPTLAALPVESRADLDDLADRLAEEWWWPPSQAAAFVLTGISPLAQTLTVERRQLAGGRTRITLDVDAAVPVDQVARAYIEARRAHVRGGRPVEAATWDAAHSRLLYLDSPAADVARWWLREAGIEPTKDAINSWRRKVKAALRRLDFHIDEED